MKEKISHFQLFSLSFQRPLCSSPWVSYLNSLLYMVFWNPMSPQCMIILHLLFLYVSGHEFYRKAGHAYRGAKSKLGGMFSPNPCNIWLSKSIKGFSSGGREVRREMSGRAAVEEKENLCGQKKLDTPYRSASRTWRDPWTVPRGSRDNASGVR